ILFSGQGHVSVGGNLTVQASSVVNQSGGTVTLGSLQKLNFELQLRASTYQPSGGGFTTGLGSAGGGTVYINGSGFANVGAMAVLTGLIRQTGGEVDVGTLSANGCSVVGTYDLEAGTFSTSVLGIQKNGGSAGNFIFNGGTLSIGTLSLSSAAQMHVG